ncbi:uroporphyrinogen-III synthase [Sphingosinicella microcystinivorans]|uniref:uroporphyrinogen-III synthase n=1 Tax=Sphingosinicella microcystinivorans TaxID=335406 RepID=UPI0022F3B37A|nr:uroporphyrinogen-III synthase [Sphingosinicella microcystinivorans]WBX84840.1 uroporphyrinogen-III synthase [Sphingosinicella microcystinivorans]
MSRVLITRPQPGAAETAARLRALGHEPVVVPLFEVAARDWTPPAAMPDAVMLTSAAAAREGGAAMAPFLGLPCFCVGERTAAAARSAGFTDVRTPDVCDGGELLGAIAAALKGNVLHLSGLEIASYAPPRGLRLDRRIVYGASFHGWSDAERAAALTAEVALVYSPRGGEALAAALGAGRSAVRLAAISRNAAAAAGDGWAARAIAAFPDEDALFAAAGLLCEKQAGEAPLTRTG